MSFTVKSVTDVITNSSTEVFTVVNKGTVDNIKKIIDLILTGTGKTWRDLYESIELEYDFDDLGYYYDRREEDRPWDELTEDEKKEWADSYNDDAYESARFPELTFIAKKGTSPELTTLLGKLGTNSINEQYACYC